MGRSNLNSFLTIVFNLLEENKFPELFSWDSEGECILIKQLELFSSTILRTYFGHENFHSFVRQLNMYNFRKTKRDASVHAYCNPFFKKGQKHMLSKLKRRKVQSKKRLEEQSENTESSPSPVYQQSVESFSKTKEQGDCCQEALRELVIENKAVEDGLQSLKEELYELKNMMADTAEYNMSTRTRLDRLEQEAQSLRYQLYLLNKPKIQATIGGYKKETPSDFKAREDFDFYSIMKAVPTDNSRERNQVLNESSRFIPWHHEYNFCGPVYKEEQAGNRTENLFSCLGFEGFD